MSWLKRWGIGLVTGTKPGWVRSLNRQERDKWRREGYLYVVTRPITHLWTFKNLEDVPEGLEDFSLDRGGYPGVAFGRWVTKGGASAPTSVFKVTLKPGLLSDGLSGPFGRWNDTFSTFLPAFVHDVFYGWNRQRVARLRADPKILLRVVDIRPSKSETRPRLRRAVDKHFRKQWAKNANPTARFNWTVVRVARAWDAHFWLYLGGRRAWMPKPYEIEEAINQRRSR